MQVINADSFRPIINPSLQLRNAQSAKKTSISIITTTTTIRPLTTVATIQSRISVSRPTSKTAPRTTIKHNDNVKTESKDAPVAEALRSEPIWRRRYRRPLRHYNALNYYNLNRSRRRPNPKPYYTPPAYNNYGSPNYEDYRYENNDQFDSNQYSSSTKSKKPYSNDFSKDYPIVDTDIGQFFDSSSATIRFKPSSNSYDYPSNYYSSSGSGTGTGYDGSDLDEYLYSTPKNALKSTTRAPAPSTTTTTKASKSKFKYFNYPPSAADDNDYRYTSSGSGSGGESGFGSDDEDEDDDQPIPPTENDSLLAKFNLFPQPHLNIRYQTAPKRKPTTTTTTTKTPPIKITDSSIDVLTKPLGSATFNLNLSPGTVYSPPAIAFNPIATNYKPIPIQPPATSYGVPIAPPLNGYTYPNPYQNPTGSYFPANNFNTASSISITNDANVKVPGRFAEPPPINQQELSFTNDKKNLYVNGQSSYDSSIPNKRRPLKRKPLKVNSKRVSTSPPVVLNTDEEINNDEENIDENVGESYSFFKTMPQPSLPNAYDQEEFHTVGKNKRRLPRPTSNYFERDERLRTTKRPAKPKVEEGPDDDYLDDLIKVGPPTKRPSKRKPTKSTTAHVLDTDDLRDAFDNENYAPLPAKPRRTKVRNRYINSQSGDYDLDYETESDDDEYDTTNDRVSHITSKEDKAKNKKGSEAEGTTSEPSYWDKSSSKINL